MEFCLWDGNAERMSTVTAASVRSDPTVRCGAQLQNAKPVMTVNHVTP